MLLQLERSLDNLKLSEYGLAISALDEVYINVCADHATEGIDFNLELINCNCFRLHTGFKRYFVQWKAMFYKKFLFTFKSPLLLITQIIIVICFAVFANIRSDMSREPHPPLNISLDIYNDPKVFYKMSNETNVKLKMRPLVFYMEDYFKNFQQKSTLTEFIGNKSTKSIIAHPTKKLIEGLDVHSIGSFEFQNTENVSIFFNNLVLHSVPIMVLLWINLITKFELGEDYNVEIVNKPLPFHRDFLRAIDVNSDKYAIFISLGLSVAFAFFSYTLTRGRVGKQILLQLLGGLRISTMWLSHLVWDLAFIIIFATIIVLISLMFQSECTATKSNILELYFILVYLGLGVVLFSYINSFWANDAFLSVAFSAVKDIIVTLFVYTGVKRMQSDIYPVTTKSIINFANDLFKINPTYGTISILFKMNKLGMTNTSCHEVCKILNKRFPEQYDSNCSAESLCTMDPPQRRQICCCK